MPPTQAGTTWGAALPSAPRGVCEVTARDRQSPQRGKHIPGKLWGRGGASHIELLELNKPTPGLSLMRRAATPKREPPQAGDY